MTTKYLLLGILIVAVFAVGFMVGRFSSLGNTFVGGTQSNTDKVQDGTDNTDSVADSGTTINAADLTDGQKKLLNALGIDANSITVTAEMIACAEGSLGANRVEEIKNGATPSFTEGLKLAACYK